MLRAGQGFGPCVKILVTLVLINLKYLPTCRDPVVPLLLPTLFGKRGIFTRSSMFDVHYIYFM